MPPVIGSPIRVAAYLREMYPQRRFKPLSLRLCISAAILVALLFLGWRSRPLRLRYPLSQPKAAKAIVSNVQNEAYVPLALTLAYTIRKYNRELLLQPVDLVLLLPQQNDITGPSLARLAEVGWQFRFEKDMEVNGTDKLPKNYRRNFIKLRLWRWVEYQKIAFLDADTLVMGDITDLLSDDYEFGAAPDVWPWIMPADNFNAGVLSLTPSLQTYDALIDDTLSKPLPPDGEQGILNRFYPIPGNGTSKHWRTVLDMKYNLNIEACPTHRAKWDVIWPDARVVHFTVFKPLRPGHAEWYEQPVQRWLEEWEEMNNVHGWEVPENLTTVPEEAS